MGRIISTFIIILFAILALIFTSLNINLVTLNFYFLSLRIPLPLIIFISIIIGSLLAAITCVWITTKKDHKIRRLEKQFMTCQNELTSLKSISVERSP